MKWALLEVDETMHGPEQRIMLLLLLLLLMIVEEVFYCWALCQVLSFVC